jgi:hypothetical protein
LENERLRADIRKLENLWFSEHYRMRELLTRAADALEGSSPLIGAEEDTGNLIAELRKAAQ